MKKTLVLIAFATASASAFAQSAPDRLLYGELGYTNFKLEDDRLPGYSSDNDALSAIIGYRFHPNLSGEVFLAGGLSTENVNYGGVNIGSKVDHSYGLYLRPSMMLSNQFEAFGRVGFLRSDLKISALGNSASESDTSFSYGAGINWHFTDNMYGQLSYTSFYDRNDTKADGYTIGLGMRF